MRLKRSFSVSESADTLIAGTGFLEVALEKTFAWRTKFYLEVSSVLHLLQ